MSARWKVFFIVLGAVIGSVLIDAFKSANAAELRVVTPKRTGTWQMATATDCYNAAQRIRVKLVKPARFFCDGRRV